MPNRLPDSTSRAPIPDRKDSDASTTFIHPHPRHGGRRLQWTRPTSANHPVYLDHHLHLVHNTPALNHDGTPHDDDRSRTRGANVTPTASPARGEHAVSGGDHGPHSQVLGPLRTRDRAMGDRDRLARVELPTRRGQSDWLLFDFSDGVASSRRPVRWSRVPRLVLRAIQCGSEHRCGRSPLLVVGTFALATLIWLAILWVVV